MGCVAGLSLGIAIMSVAVMLEDRRQTAQQDVALQAMLDRMEQQGYQACVADVFGPALK